MSEDARTNFEKLRDAFLTTAAIEDNEEYQAELNALPPELVDQIIAAASTPIDDDGGAGAS